MTVDELRDLAKRIIDDVRTTDQQKGVVADLVDEMRTITPASRDRVERQLNALRDQIEGRAPARSPAHDAMRWATMTQPLSATEKRWEKRAMRQFTIAALMIPALLVTMVVLAIRMPHEPFMLVFLSELASLALAYSYILFRVHQQATTAEERMAEKLVGLTFLRMVLEEYGDHPHFESLLEHGTQMFLGHHAPNTILLGPDDLAGLMKKAKSGD